MVQKFVLLASGLKAGVNIDILKAELKTKFKGVPNPFPQKIDGTDVRAFNLSDNDGPLGDGSGGGNEGGAQKVIRGKLGETFWQFQIRPAETSHEMSTVFPPIIRYELCLTFDSYRSLMNYFDNDPGNKLKDYFDWVQYVAVTDPI